MHMLLYLFPCILKMGDHADTSDSKPKAFSVASPFTYLQNFFSDKKSGFHDHATIFTYLFNPRIQIKKLQKC